MADTLVVRIQSKSDDSSAWVANNPVLLDGELGYEKDTNKFKFGNGTTAWNSLPFAASDATGYMLKSLFATNAKANTGYVDKAIAADTSAEATKLINARAVSLTGDVTATGVNFDGTAALVLTTVLKSVVTAGTYAKVTVNEKGLVTAFSTLTAADIPTLTASKISDLGTAALANTGTAIGNVAIVGADGKIDSSLLPPIAITDVFEAATQTAMLALVAQVGDICVRSDINRSYILKAAPASTLANWIELRTPTDTVLSVNNKTGAVTLTTSDITEGTNLFFTEARASANFAANIAATASTALTDGVDIMRLTGDYILNCGTSVLT